MEKDHDVQALDKHSFNEQNYWYLLFFITLLFGTIWRIVYLIYGSVSGNGIELIEDIPGFTFFGATSVLFIIFFKAAMFKTEPKGFNYCFVGFIVLIVITFVVYVVVDQAVSNPREEYKFIVEVIIFCSMFTVAAIQMVIIIYYTMKIDYNARFLNDPILSLICATACYTFRVAIIVTIANTSNTSTNPFRLHYLSNLDSLAIPIILFYYLLTELLPISLLLCIEFGSLPLTYILRKNIITTEEEKQQIKQYDSIFYKYFIREINAKDEH